MGDSRLETAGLGGSLRLGNDVGPVGGADMGTLEKGLGGTSDAEAEARAFSIADALSDAVILILTGGGDDLLLAVDVEGECSSWVLSALSLESVPGADSGVVSPEAMAGECRDMALERKSA